MSNFNSFMSPSNSPQSSSRYDTLVFTHAKWVLLVFALILVSLWPFLDDFRLDTSSDSLVLENDKSLKYFRDVVSNYSVMKPWLIFQSFEVNCSL